MDGDLRNLMARPLHYERFYGESRVASSRELPADRRPALAINEWGLDLPESQQYSILGALYGARLMNVFERRGSHRRDERRVGPRERLAGRHHSGQPPRRVRDADLPGQSAVCDTPRCGAAGDAASTARRSRPAREGSDVPVLDVVASRSADGRSIFIKAVNTDLEQPVTLTVTLHGARVSSSAIVDRVTAPSLQAVASFKTPDAVRLSRSSLKAAERFQLELPKHSVSVVTLSVAK